jgi:hypothetical protein
VITIFIYNSGSVNNVDSMIYFESPYKIYQYPLKNATQWCYANLGGYKFYRKIMGTDEIEVDAGMFFCYHIRHHYDPDGDGI